MRVPSVVTLTQWHSLWLDSRGPLVVDHDYDHDYDHD